MENTDRIPFTLTFRPHNHVVKSIILKNFQLLQNDSETGTFFSKPPLTSFKRDKNVGNCLVRSSLQTNAKTSLKLSNALAHDEKLVLSFITQRKCRDPRDPLRSLIALSAPAPMSFTA